MGTARTQHFEQDVPQHTILTFGLDPGMRVCRSINPLQLRRIIRGEVTARCWHGWYMHCGGGTVVAPTRALALSQFATPAT